MFVILILFLLFSQFVLSWIDFQPRDELPSIRTNVNTKDEIEKYIKFLTMLEKMPFFKTVWNKKENDGEVQYKSISEKISMSFVRHGSFLSWKVEIRDGNSANRLGQLGLTIAKVIQCMMTYQYQYDFLFVFICDSYRHGKCVKDKIETYVQDQKRRVHHILKTEPPVIKVNIMNNIIEMNGQTNQHLDNRLIQTYFSSCLKAMQDRACVIPLLFLAT